MTEEEFERWKVDNGWYITAGDLIFFLALMVFVGLIVWAS
jgi:hypothetical protein